MCVQRERCAVIVLPKMICELTGVNATIAAVKCHC